MRLLAFGVLGISCAFGFCWVLLCLVCSADLTDLILMIAWLFYFSFVVCAACCFVFGVSGVCVSSLLTFCFRFSGFDFVFLFGLVFGFPSFRLGLLAC